MHERPGAARDRRTAVRLLDSAVCETFGSCEIPRSAGVREPTSNCQRSRLNAPLLATPASTEGRKTCKAAACSPAGYPSGCLSLRHSTLIARDAMPARVGGDRKSTSNVSTLIERSVARDADVVKGGGLLAGDGIKWVI